MVFVTALIYNLIQDHIHIKHLMTNMQADDQTIEQFYDDTALAKKIEKCYGLKIIGDLNLKTKEK